MNDVMIDGMDDQMNDGMNDGMINDNDEFWPLLG